MYNALYLLPLALRALIVEVEVRSIDLVTIIRAAIWIIRTRYINALCILIQADVV